MSDDLGDECPWPEAKEKGATPAEWVEQTNKLIFCIERNKNTNVVVYEANLKDGKLDSKDPVTVYWKSYHSKNGEREEISWMEKKMAYGVSVDKKTQSAEGVYFSLVAFKARKLLVKVVDGAAQGFMEINGKEQRLKKIYIKAKETKMLPQVEYVKLTGLDESGAVVTEIIKP